MQPNVTPARIRQVRDLILRHLFAQGAAACEGSVPVEAVKRSLRLSDADFVAAYLALLNQKLLAPGGPAGCLRLSPDGQAEARLLPPAAATPPAVRPDELRIQVAYRVGVANGTPAGPTVDTAAVEPLLDALERDLPAHGLTPAAQDHAAALLAALRQGLAHLPTAGLQAMAGALASLLPDGGRAPGRRLRDALRLEPE